MGEEITAEEIRGVITDEAEEEGPETPDVDPDAEEREEKPETEQPPELEGKKEEEEEEEPKKPEPETENAIPQSEFDRRYAGWKSKEREYQEKIDLLRTDPDAYYAKYPDEKPPPAPKEQAAQAPDRVPTFSECLNAPITDGQFNGYTLGQLWESDNPSHRAVAVDIYNNYRDSVQSQITERKTQERSKEEEFQSSVKKEHEEFYSARAKELFGKDASSLSTEENGKIQGLVNDLLDQMEDLGVYRLEAAYKLATMDERLKSAQGESIKAVIDSIRKGSHVSGPETKRTGSGSADVYERMQELSEEELAAKLEGLSIKEMETFWKKAPQSFRSKFQAAADAWT